MLVSQIFTSSQPPVAQQYWLERREWEGVGEVGQYRGKPGQGAWGLMAVGQSGDGGTQGWIG